MGLLMQLLLPESRDQTYFPKETQQQEETHRKDMGRVDRKEREQVGVSQGSAEPISGLQRPSGRE